MRPIFIFLCFFFVYTTSCQSKVASNQKEEKEQTVYLNRPFPFIMEGISHSVALPKSFQTTEKGKAIVYLFINDQGKKEGFSIVFLKLGNENAKRFYEYSNAPKEQAEYPSEIQPFFSVFKKEIAKIEIKKKKNTQILKEQKYYYAIAYDLE
ncbi:MAG TPA: hypothetical protein ENK85_02275 [Saprospiraceae bacterium]|nr:hypothetical protein [Saprospiraceae bacterium]